jgi:hypothetical protein
LPFDESGGSARLALAPSPRNRSRYGREPPRAAAAAVIGEFSSVSAFDVPRDVGRFQTVFTALHHFQPTDAIAVIEPFNRKAMVATTIGGFLPDGFERQWLRG